MMLTAAEKAILVSASEDWCSLFMAELEVTNIDPARPRQEVAREAVSSLVTKGLVNLVLVQEPLGSPSCEVEQYPINTALEILADSAKWGEENFDMRLYYALTPTPPGRTKFLEIIGTSERKRGFSTS